LYGDTLYFASEGHRGLGGLDVFKTYFGNNDQWIRPVNLGAPINSGADDFGYFIDTFSTQTVDIAMQGYITSSREGGKGKDDIYRFVKSKPEASLKEEEDAYLLNVRVLTPVYSRRDDPNSEILRYAPVEGARLMIDQEEVNTDITGRISRKLEMPEEFRIKGEKQGFLSSTRTVDMSEFQVESRTVDVRLILDRIFYGKEVVLDDILYDFEKWDIRDDAKPSLDSLVILLNENAFLRISLSSHTDCRGEDDFNVDLSQKRAQSAVDYLIEKGISPRRLRADGYGETRPKVKCVCAECSEEEHQANRRTAFTILP